MEGWDRKETNGARFREKGGVDICEGENRFLISWRKPWIKKRRVNQSMNGNDWEDDEGINF